MIRLRVGSLQVARARLFVISYAPLGAMFAARFSAKKEWLLVALFTAFFVIGVVDAVRLVRGASKHARRRTQSHGLVDQGSAVSGYLATYLLPFLGNLPETFGDWFAYLIYFIVALVVHVKSDLALVNPTLYALGYRVLKGVVDNQNVLVVAPDLIEDKSTLEVSSLMGDMIVVHRVCHNNDHG